MCWEASVQPLVNRTTQEAMDIGMWKLVLASFAFHLVITGGQPSVDEHEENQQLKTLLRQSREQNRRLEKQMSRLKLVWAGLEAMCDVLSSASTSESESMVTPGPTVSQPETAPLRVLAASSSGNISGEVTLTVSYTAPRVHNPDWFVVYVNRLRLRNMIRTGGTTTSLGDGKYTSTMAVPFSGVPEAISLHLYTKSEAVGLQFNVHAVVSATEEAAPAYTSPIRDMFVRRQDGVNRQLLIDEAQVAPTTGDMYITLVMNGTLHQLDYVAVGAQLSMTGLTTVNGTTEYYEIYTSDAIGWSGSDKTNTTSEFVLSVKEPYVQRGGVLSVLIPVIEASNPVLQDGLFESVHIRHNITILPPDSTELVPENTLGIRPWPTTTTVAAANHSLMCIAMGNPQPKLQIFRELADGRRRELPTESLMLDSRMSIAHHTFDASTTKVQGSYICRAESGDAFVEEQTEVIVYYPVIFDEAKTGIIKNNTNKVVFGCKAKSKQRPELQFRSPNIATFERFKVTNTKIGKSGRRLTLTMSPPDYEVHTVHCVSRLYGVEEYRKLELFPGRGIYGGNFNNTTYIRG